MFSAKSKPYVVITLGAEVTAAIFNINKTKAKEYLDE